MSVKLPHGVVPARGVLTTELAADAGETGTRSTGLPNAAESPPTGWLVNEPLAGREKDRDALLGSASLRVRLIRRMAEGVAAGLPSKGLSS